MQSQDRKYKVLVMATGSVATIKVTQLIQRLKQFCQIRLVLTQNANHFISSETLNCIKTEHNGDVYQDADEYVLWKQRGDPVLHIQLRKWADAIVLAPLSANILAKISTGICDNLVTLICRCWDMTLRPPLLTQGKIQENSNKKLKKPIIACPAMNTMMWQHPITNQQLNVLKKWGYTIVGPVQKTLMCGQKGLGAMSSIEQIAEALIQELEIYFNQESQ